MLDIIEKALHILMVTVSHDTGQSPFLRWWKQVSERNDLARFTQSRRGWICSLSIWHQSLCSASWHVMGTSVGAFFPVYTESWPWQIQILPQMANPDHWLPSLFSCPLTFSSGWRTVVWWAKACSALLTEMSRQRFKSAQQWQIAGSPDPKSRCQSGFPCIPNISNHWGK